jgi:hypothetical protein
VGWIQARPTGSVKTSSSRFPCHRAAGRIPERPPAAEPLVHERRPFRGRGAAGIVRRTPCSSYGSAKLQPPAAASRGQSTGGTLRGAGLAVHGRASSGPAASPSRSPVVHGNRSYAAPNSSPLVASIIEREWLALGRNNSIVPWRARAARVRRGPAQAAFRMHGARSRAALPGGRGAEWRAGAPDRGRADSTGRPSCGMAAS